jgi:uncharacterized membrane protein
MNYMIECLLFIVLGIYLIFKAFTSNESFLKFSVSVDENPYLFKFLNFAIGPILLVIGIGLICKRQF